MTALLLLAADPRSAQSHPASGIVVSGQGKINCTDVRRGLLEIDPEGQLTLIHREGAPIGSPSIPLAPSQRLTLTNHQP